ncbi:MULTISPECIES: fimbria/pilus periplasmic chaperone [unclassified Serratia (in: enterobacteria)]|uniref:fimbria/pilus periplasmic chaperone n=1 Tax=unclassified Serratia (in: enterobacteria) TaxID=2647522 RepID=UPI003FA78317
MFSKLTNAFIFLALTTQMAFAGMTISGTRIIFPGAEREKTVRTTNKGNMPLLAQVWVDDGSANDDINSVKVPFTVTPPVYRVEPGKGQSIRLIYNGMNLPQDRESVFWFNLLEIPPMKDAAKETDHLELAFRTRIKIFYRPTVLKSSSTNEVDKLKWEIISPAKGIKVTNPTPYYYSFDSASMTSGDIKYPLNVDMIPPFGSKEFLLENKNNAPVAANGASINLISDYGSVVEYKLIPASGKGLIIKE